MHSLLSFSTSPELSAHVALCQFWDPVLTTFCWSITIPTSKVSVEQPVGPVVKPPVPMGQVSVAPGSWAGPCGSDTGISEGAGEGED